VQMTRRSNAFYSNEGMRWRWRA